MNPHRVFDQKHYEGLNTSRAAVVSRLLGELKDRLGLHTAVDVGCGLGYFSSVLRSQGLRVSAVDGRQENTEEAKRRHPEVVFHTSNVEDPGFRELGEFDLVLCFGLLYHLENPLLAIRSLRAMTTQLLLAESVIFPGSEPIMALIDEEIHEDQGLRHLAFYPTEACLTKMFYRAGFAHVYQLADQPNHPDYCAKGQSRRVRTMLAASLNSIRSQQLKEVQEPASAIRPWDALSSERSTETVKRLRKLAGAPLSEKMSALKRAVKGSEQIK